MMPPRTIVVGALCAAEVVEVGMWGVVVAGGGRTGIGDGEDSGMSSNNSLYDGFSESSFSMV